MSSSWQGPFGTPQKSSSSTNEGPSSSSGSRASRRGTGSLENALLNTPMRQPRGPPVASMEPVGTPRQTAQRRQSDYHGSPSHLTSSVASMEHVHPARHQMSSNWRAVPQAGADGEASVKSSSSGDQINSPSMNRSQQDSALSASGSASTQVSHSSTSLTESHAGYDLDSPLVVIIAHERVNPGATPENPQFMAKYASLTSAQNYYNIVLPHIAKLTFILENTPDVNFLHNWLNAAKYPQLRDAITKLAFPKLFWFSGIAGNRKTNPCLAFASSLPAVEEITLAFHTAGLTTSNWAERERLRIEAYDVEKSKQLKVLRLQDVIKNYDLERIFRCKALKKVHLECYNSPMVQYFTRSSEPLSPFHDLQHWIQSGFMDFYGKNVEVDSKVFELAS